MDTFQMNQDLVSAKSRINSTWAERRDFNLPDYQEKYFAKYYKTLPGFFQIDSFDQAQKKGLLVELGERPALRFSEAEATKSSFVDQLVFWDTQKINNESFKDETANAFEGFGIAREDTSMLLSLAKIVRSGALGKEESEKTEPLLKKVEIFYKLSSRGTLSKESLINHTAGLLDEMDSIIPYLLKNGSGISAELLNEVIDNILSIRRSAKSVYSQIATPVNRYESLKKTIDSWSKEKIQDSRWLLLRYQEMIEDIDTLLTEKNEQGKPILNAKQKKYLTNSRERLQRDYLNVFEKTVVTEDWATKDTEMKQFQGGFFYLCESVKCKDPKQLGNLRRKKLERFVTEMVNKWTPHDIEIPKSWLESHTNNIVGKLKKQIIKNGISKLIVYLFPMIVGGVPREKPENEEDELKRIKDYDLTGVMPAFFKGLDKTMGDVVNWAWEMKADSIESFEFTGSDLHDMGLGVCKVEFKKQGVSKRFVIKPDDRQFEQIVFGKKGFAEEFNRSVENGQVELIDPYDPSGLKKRALGKVEKIDAVRTFEMQSSESKKHGVIIEHLKIAQISNSSEGVGEVIDGEVNSQGRLFAQLICGIFGISDLHERNVGYWEIYLKKIFYPALADSECGMDLFLLGSFAEASAQSGFYDVKDKKYLIDEKWKLSIDEPLFIKLIHCIDVLFDQTNPIRCRRVPIGTDEQEWLRADFLKYSFSEVKRVVKSYLDRRKETALDSRKVESGNEIEEFVEDFEKKWSIYIGRINRNSRLLEFCGEDKLPIFESTDEQFETALNCAIEDYHEGKIPFYEMNPVTGELTTHKGAVVGKYMPKLNDRERIEMMKKMMMSNIYVREEKAFREEKAWNYYQRTLGLSYII